MYSRGNILAGSMKKLLYKFSFDPNPSHTNGPAWRFEVDKWISSDGIVLDGEILRINHRQGEPDAQQSLAVSEGQENEIMGALHGLEVAQDGTTTETTALEGGPFLDGFGSGSNDFTFNMEDLEWLEAVQ